ncbi:restriction endonuclease subunit S [Candidatus Saccharibacteria bacterium]|nr:restriction endonuclease subunit S [Candidatus Saccharibacteria bacterium]
MTNWQTKKLGELGEWFKGAGIAKDDANSGDLPAVRYGELYTTYNIKIEETRSGISEQVASQSQEIQYGDIIFAGSGESIDEIAKSAVYLLDKNGYASGDTLILRPNSENNPVFLAYLLNSPLARKNLRAIGQGKSIVHAHIKEMIKIELPVPDRKTQDDYANKLDVFDRTLISQDVEIERMIELKKGLMQQIFSGKLRFKDDNGGGFPAWEKKKLSEIATITTGKKDVNQGNPNGEYPFFTCAKTHTYSDGFSFSGEAILIAGNGEVGLCQYYNGDFEAYQRTYVLQDFKIDGKFLFRYLSFAFQNFVNAQKQTSAMPYIKLGMLQTFPVITPTIAEQRKIATFLSDFDAQIDTLKSLRDETAKQKKWLLNNLVTGKVRLPQFKGKGG